MLLQTAYILSPGTKRAIHDLQNMVVMDMRAKTAIDRLDSVVLQTNHHMLAILGQQLLGDVMYTANMRFCQCPECGELRRKLFSEFDEKGKIKALDVMREWEVATFKPTMLTDLLREFKEVQSGEQKSES